MNTAAVVTSRTDSYQRPKTFDPADADHLDDAALDELSFGVICIAEDGTILRYNAAEGRLARLDPATVVGRNFFTDVAPCTYTEEFYGRFKAFSEGSSAGDMTHFDYVFDFKFGAQRVDVELFRANGGDHYYLFVNRTAFLPKRSDSKAREPAPRQRDLVPAEEKMGVRRNSFAQRFVGSPVVLFEALRQTFKRLPDRDWARLCQQWGARLGRMAVVDLEVGSLETAERPLRDRPMADVAAQISEYFRDQGWGLVSFDLTESPAGLLGVRIHASALASRRSKDQRTCHLLAGMLEAIVSHLAGRRLHARELSCAAQPGHEHCELVVFGPRRLSTVKTFLTDGSGTIGELIGALQRDEKSPRPDHA